MTKSMTPATSKFFIDITGEVCPMTFVKTKLALEKLPLGQTLEVRLMGKEPLHNVPRSAIDHGYHVLSLVPEEADHAEHGVHRLMIKNEK